MFKSFYIIGVICSPFFECMEFTPTNNQKYNTEKKCMVDADKYKEELSDRFVLIGIPHIIEIKCIRNKKWQA